MITPSFVALIPFLPKFQCFVIAENLEGEEREFFTQKVDEIQRIIDEMPVTYQQEGLGDQAIVYLHYFFGNCHWFITEKDIEGDGTIHAFGMADLKSCVSASKEAFAKAVATYGYDVEAAFYIDGMKEVTGKTVDFYFIAVEKTVPYSTACYKASQEMVEVGRAKYRGALELLKWCQENSRFPGYQPSGEIESIDLPRWAASFELEA